MNSITRCPWAKTELSIAYHDAEWGVPRHDDRVLFEFLILEGAQAGLSWETILNKREAYRAVYRGFDPAVVARFTARDVTKLLGNAGIVRHRGKIESSIANAKIVLDLQREHGSLAAYLWRFADPGGDGRPIVHRRRSLKDVPATSPESDAMSKALKKLGMKFVGSTICYAFMQAVGMVNDHLVICPRHDACGRSTRG